MSAGRVLIVDDHAGFRAAARDLLHARGYTVVAEADGQSSALEALARFAPDAVMLDVLLGDKSGFDVARALMRVQPDLAVLLVSAKETDVQAARLRECGARGFVSKRQLVRSDLAHLLGM
jgi:DNA-binding NarL/FixJ family response regulator